MSYGTLWKDDVIKKVLEDDIMQNILEAGTYISSQVSVMYPSFNLLGLPPSIVASLLPLHLNPTFGEILSSLPLSLFPFGDLVLLKVLP